MMSVNIANALSKRGVESHICVTRLEGSLKQKLFSDVGYIFLDKKSIFDFKAICKLKSYIKKNKIEIIHAHSTSYFIAFLVKLLYPKVKIIWHDHYGESEHLGNRKTVPLNYISSCFKAIISVNEKLVWWANKYLKTKKVVCLSNFAAFENEIIEKTYLSGNTGKRIVCLANLRAQKDHLNLLKAFEIVNSKYHEWTLHLVGADFNDEYSEKIKNFIKSNNLGNHVFLYGSCSDTEFILKQSTIGVLSSNSEGLPVSLLEYGLCTLPVVVTNVGDCNKVIDNQNNGLIIEPNSSIELANAIEYLIVHEDKRIKFGKNLFQTVKSKYSELNYITNLLNLYTIG